ncbi:MAG: DNA polymerase, partial [Myxococcota bacterium]
MREYFVCDSVTMALGAVEHEGRGTDEAPVAVFALIDQAPPHAPELVGVALSPRVGRAVYVPVLGPDGALGADGAVALRSWLADPQWRKVVHDAKSAHVALAESGLRLDGLAGDVALASYRLDPTRIVPHTPLQIAREYLQIGLTAPAALTGTGKSRVPFASLPVDRAGAFACQYADAIGAAWQVLRPRLAAEGHREGLETVDLPLARVLADMELAGVQVDRRALATLGEQLKDERKALRKTIRELAGRAFNPASPKQLGEVLFEALELPVVKRTKRGPSVDAEVLDALRDKHPIIAPVQRFRTVDQMVHTYTDVLTAAVREDDGRIHPTFLATLSVSGRLHTTDPDLQRTPLHDPEFRTIREAFVAREGHRLVAGDWSQMELAVLAHLSGDAALSEALRSGQDLHVHTARALFETDAPSPEQRNAGKAINYATIYGQGPRALGKRLGVKMSEAKAWITQFFALYPGVERWRDETLQRAQADGYVTTWAGRRRYLPDLWAGDPATRSRAERQAINTPVQGSAADLCKQAMVQLAPEVAALGGRLLLQIHDELLVET